MKRGVGKRFADLKDLRNKLMHFSDGVNVTMGLPIVRTSVDHGTAYDIAGKGLADHASLAEAVNMAHSIAENRQKSIPLPFS